MDYNFTVDPKDVYRRIRKPYEIEGSPSEMYRVANDEWMEFLDALSEGDLEKADGHLELVDMALQRGEIGVQKSRSGEKEYEIVPAGEDYSQR